MAVATATMAQTTVADQINAIDWAYAESDRANSIYKGLLDLERFVAPVQGVCAGYVES
jgi:hypothetical protein